MSDHYRISYQIVPVDGNHITYELDINSDTVISTSTPEHPPEWTQLEYKQCSHCTLADTPHCPIALRLVEPIKKLKHLKSFDRVDVTVSTAERNYQKNVDAQEAMRSLFGLIMASSGCPSMKPFRYMARYHLPFSSEEESLQRLLASSLMQNLMNDSAAIPTSTDLKERISTFYTTILKLNEAMAMRLKHPDYAESAVNAVVIFSAQSTLIPLMMDKEIKKLQKYF